MSVAHEPRENWHAITTDKSWPTNQDWWSPSTMDWCVIADESPDDVISVYFWTYWPSES